MWLQTARAHWCWRAEQLALVTQLVITGPAPSCSERMIKMQAMGRIQWLFY